MKKYIFLLFSLPVLFLNAQSSDLFPMVPGVPVVHSPKSSGIFRGTPSLALIPNGNIVASNDVFGTGADGKSIPNRTDIFISRDKGLTWTFKSSVSGAVWSGLFFVNNKLYLMGGDTSNGANFVIRSSSDQGTTWSAPTVLIPGPCHGSSTPVLIANNRIYRSYEHHYEDANGKWMSGNKSFIISAPINSDLMNASNWTVTDEIAKPAWLDGTGWLESNAVLGRDGKVKGISRLASMEGIYAGYYSLSSDSKIDETTARKIQFWGGASKFNIKYDPITDKYWSLTNYAPALFKEGNVSAGGIRSVLALTSSYDMEEWDINAIVLAHTDIVNVGFQYVDWLFDGNDIIFTSRTAYDDGLGGAKNFHDANFMTFHRISNFSMASTPAEWQYLLPNDKWNGVVMPIDESLNKGATKDNPILINHPGQLVYLSEQVYRGNSYAGKYFLMTNDIDLNEFNFLPIGWYITTTNNRPFSGHFDGGGYKILNFKINRNDDSYNSNGVFGYMSGGSVTNLGISGNSNIYVGGVSAGIVAYARGTIIEKCYSNVNLQGSSQAGGIVGYGVSSPTVNNCYNTGNIHLASSMETNKYAGGIIGFTSTGIVSNNYNVGNVTALFSSTTNLGGISGYASSNVVNSYYRSDCIVGGNNLGVSKTETGFKASEMIGLLNNNQSQFPWEVDSNGLNSGYPVLKWQNEVLSSVPNLEFVNSKFEIKEIAPNPVKDVSFITFEQKESAYVSLTLYNAFGIAVLKIYEGYLNTGNYEFALNAHNLPSGIYLHEFMCDKNYRKVNKIIVSK